MTKQPKQMRRDDQQRRAVDRVVRRDRVSGRKARQLGQIRAREQEGELVSETIYALALHLTRQSEPEASVPNLKNMCRALTAVLERRDYPHKTDEGERILVQLDEALMERMVDEAPGVDERLADRQVLEGLFEGEREELVGAWVARRQEGETIRSQAASLQIEESYLGKQLRELEQRAKGRGDRERRGWGRAASGLRGGGLLALLVACGAAIRWWWKRWKRHLVLGGAGLAMVGAGWWGWSRARPPVPERPASSLPLAWRFGESAAPLGVRGSPAATVVERPVLGTRAGERPATAPRPERYPELAATRPADLAAETESEEPDDVVALCTGKPGADLNNIALSRAGVALLLLARDPATPEEREVLGHLLERPGGAFVYADLPAPSRADLQRLDAMLTEPHTEDCPSLLGAAMYVMSLRQVYRGHGEACWGQSGTTCNVGSSQLLQSDHLVTIVCRALFHNAVGYEGAAESDSACHPAFHAPHPSLRGGPWATNDWYAPPATVLAELIEATGAPLDGPNSALSRDAYLDWLRTHPPGAPVSMSHAQTLLALLPSRFPREIR